MFCYSLFLVVLTLFFISCKYVNQVWAGDLENQFSNDMSANQSEDLVQESEEEKFNAIIMNSLEEMAKAASSYTKADAREANMRKSCYAQDWPIRQESNNALLHKEGDITQDNQFLKEVFLKGIFYDLVDFSLTQNSLFPEKNGEVRLCTYKEIVSTISSVNSNANLSSVYPNGVFFGLFVFLSDKTENFTKRYQECNRQGWKPREKRFCNVIMFLKELNTALDMLKENSVFVNLGIDLHRFKVGYEKDPDNISLLIIQNHILSLLYQWIHSVIKIVKDLSLSDNPNYMRLFRTYVPPFVLEPKNRFLIDRKGTPLSSQENFEDLAMELLG